MIIRDSIRMVLPTRHVLFGLTVRMDDYSLDGVRVVPLIRAPSGETGWATQAFQLHRAVGIRGRDHEGMFYAQYSWTGEHSSGPCTSAFLSLSNPLRDRLPNIDEHLVGVSGRCLLDQYTNRVVVTNFDATRFFTIFTTEFTSEGEAISGDDVPSPGSSDYESDATSSEDASSDGSTACPEDMGCRIHDREVSRKGSSNASPEAGSFNALGEDYSDDEISWKGVGPLGDDADAESGTESHEEGSVEEPEGEGELEASGTAYSDDEISWKGVGSAGDYSEDENAQGNEVSDGESGKARVVSLSIREEN